MGIERAAYFGLDSMLGKFRDNVGNLFFNFRPRRFLDRRPALLGT